MSGGMAIGGTIALGLLIGAEALWARDRLLPSAKLEVVPRSGVFGEEFAGKPLELALLGDSLAAGMGARSPDESIGVLLANGLASASRRPVRLRNVAIVGSESEDLSSQIDKILAGDVTPHVAVIVVGGNEVMRLRNVSVAVGFLSDAVRQLRRRGCQVVVATCPDMGTVRPFVPPLRFIAHWASRVLATAQTIVVLRAGGRTVSLADTLGPVFWREPRLMFSTDRLHPSSEGYARAAEVLMPSVFAAAGYRTNTESIVPHRIYRKDLRTPLLVWLAFRASRRAGLETSAHDAHEGRLIEVGQRALIRIRGRILPLVRLHAHAP